MKKLKFYFMMLFSCLLLTSVTGCSDDDDTPLTVNQRIQGTWKVVMQDGDWDEYTFNADNTAKYRYFDSADGSIAVINFKSYDASETMLTLITSDNDLKVYAIDLDGDELMIGDYIYFKE